MRWKMCLLSRCSHLSKYKIDWMHDQQKNPIRKVCVQMRAKQNEMKKMHWNCVAKSFRSFLTFDNEFMTEKRNSNGLFQRRYNKNFRFFFAMIFIIITFLLNFEFSVRSFLLRFLALLNDQLLWVIIRDFFCRSKTPTNSRAIIF